MQDSLFAPFLGSVTLAAWIGGFWPGMFACLLSTLIIHGTLLPDLPLLSEIVRIGSFGIIGALVSLLASLRRIANSMLECEQAILEARVEERTRELSQANARLETEIAERRRAEESLRESQERFRLLFEEAPIAYHEIGADGVVRRVNRAECDLLGYGSPDEIVGQPVWDLVSPQWRALARENVLGKLAGTRPLEPFVREYRTAGGESIWVEIHERAIRDRTGAVTGIRSALLDVTARREAEDAIRHLNADLEQRVQARTADLERSNEALQQFAYSASHDLQEPLRMVSSYAKLLERRYKDQFDESGREFLYYIVDGAERMSRLITDLLAFSRAGNSSAQPPPEVDMEDVVRTAASNLQQAIEESDASISADPLPRVVAYPEGLAQVVQNLLSNSLKYRSVAAPQVRISCEQQSDEWIFCVADNGLGFDQELADRAFGIFKRLHGRDYPGTGIGLAIAKRIIERNGGRIWAESEPGTGARFFFSIPKRAGASPAVAQHA
jgi:PAS domain S-box-containing protein